jgi:hypothetical protein
MSIKSDSTSPGIVKKISSEKRHIETRSKKIKQQQEQHTNFEFFKMSNYQGGNAVAGYSPYTYAACQSTVRSPIGLHGMSHPTWVQTYKDPQLTDAVHLNALSGLGCERGQNAPSRDESYFQVMIEQRPVFQLPEEITRESEFVPSIWNKQVEGSCGMDIGNDQLYVSSDYVLYCSGKPI